MADTRPKLSLTLPTPTATITGGFVFLINEAAILRSVTGAADNNKGNPLESQTTNPNAFANGGGSLIAYADEALTVRLPLHVVAFVTGASPAVQLFIRTEGYVGGELVHLVHDDVQTSQPLPSAAYGQYATYADYLRVFNFHGGALVDDSGNGSALVLGGTTTPTPLSEQGYLFSDGYLNAGAIPLDGLSEVSVFCSFKNAEASADRGIWYLNNDEGTTDSPFGLRQDVAVVGSTELTTFQSSFGETSYRRGHKTNSSKTTKQISVNVFDSGVATVYMDGVNDVGAILNTNNSTTLDVGGGDFRIGTGAKGRYVGEVYSLQIRTTETSSSYVKAEYDNQSDPTNWFTSVSGYGVEDDVGGGPWTLQPSRIESTLICYAPIVTKDKLIALDYIESTALVEEPIVTKDLLINLETIESTVVVNGPLVLKAHKILLGPLVNFSVVLPPIVTGGIQIEIGGISFRLQLQWQGINRI